MQAKNDKILMWGAIALVLAVLGGYVALPQGISGGLPAAPGNQGTTCNQYGNAESLDVSAVDSINKGTALTESAYYWVNGAYVGTIAGGTAVNVQPASAYQMLVFNDTTYSTTGYYKSKMAGTLPCAAAATLPAELALQGSVALSVFNPDDGLINAAANTFDIGSGACETGKFRVKENTADAYLTNPETGKFLVMLDMGNNSELDSAKSKVVGATKVSVPSGQTGTYDTAWEVTGALKDYESKDLDIVLCAVTGINPTSAMVNATAKFMDYDHFVTDDNALASGPEDTDSNADVGMSDTGNTVTVFIG